MAKALIIKGADFSENAVETITVEIPCTGINLSVSTLTFDQYLEQKSFSYSLVPVTTTQSVSITCSDTDVCTVNGTTVTAVGIGTAVITVSCGNVSETITITISDLDLDLDSVELATSWRGDATSGPLGVTDDNNYDTIGNPYESEAALKLFKGVNAQLSEIVTPFNASKINVKQGTSRSVLAYFGDNTTPSAVAYISYSGVSNKSGTSINYDIPSGANCVILSFASSGFSLEDVESITFS